VKERSGRKKKKGEARTKKFVEEKRIRETAEKKSPARGKKQAETVTKKKKASRIWRGTRKKERAREPPHGGVYKK